MRPLLGNMRVTEVYLYTLKCKDEDFRLGRQLS